ncbi:MAG: hypothetical protein JRD71_00735 [Deltaproteobacteria bacterium]|nr:hypothetical protein [Deltaproteobacteria bacterium]
MAEGKGVREGRPSLPTASGYAFQATPRQDAAARKGRWKSNRKNEHRKSNVEWKYGSVVINREP